MNNISLFIIFVGLGCLCFVETPLSQQEAEVSIGEPSYWSCGSIPVWVMEYQFKGEEPSIRSSAVDEIRLYSDYQTDIESKTGYLYELKKIINEGGAQKNSYFSVDFDPQYQVITMHKLCIWRDGSVIDLLETADFEVIQREQSLENYIYSGQQSLITFLEDVRVGDILEVSYSVQGENPVFDGKFFDTVYLDVVPREHYVYRLLIPEGRKINYKNHGIDCDPVITTLDDGKEEWLWEFDGLEAAKMEPGMPTWTCPFHFIELSEFDSWGSCISWAKDLFVLPEEYSAELKALISDIEKNYDTDEERALAALRYVQDHIRYLGVEAGLASHQPSQPNEVFKRRYGDCKDKTLLLHAILYEMRIESYPALVHTVLQHKISDMLPCPAVFNHAILAIQIAGKIYWVDPTAALEGGCLSSRSCSHYGKALMINPNSQGLSTIDYTQTGPNIETSTMWDVSDRRLEAQLTIRIVFRGGSADYIRRIVQHGGEAKIFGECLDGAAQQYGEVQEASPSTYHDDRQKNEIVTVQKYTIRNPWDLNDNKKWKRLALYPGVITSAGFSSYLGSNRRHPVAVGYPLHIREKIEFKGVTLGDFSDFHRNFEDDAISCTIRGKVRNRRHLSLEYEYKTHKDHVTVEDIGKHRIMMNKLKRAIITEVTAPAGR